MSKNRLENFLAKKPRRTNIAEIKRPTTEGITSKNALLPYFDARPVVLSNAPPPVKAATKLMADVIGPYDCDPR
jgi:hypothetical protein